MRKVMVIPTYWAREKSDGWHVGDAVYDHPTPIDEEGTLRRTLESMRILSYKDFKLVLIICPTTPEIANAAEKRVLDIVNEAALQVETYLLTISDLEKFKTIFSGNDAPDQALPLVSLAGYANVRNMCLMCANILDADAALLIDDDEVFEISDFVERAVEFLGKRVYGDVVYGMAGYYLNKNDQYYDDVVPESWMTYWDRFVFKAKAYDEIIGCAPRIKRTPFAFGGAMIIHRDLFRSVPFDPQITRGEDLDYLINSRMFGFSFFLDNTLSIKHLPVKKKHPEWKRIREDIYRFVYERSKLNSQYKTSNMVLVTAEDFDPYPGAFLKGDLDEMIFRSNSMLAMQYMAQGNAEGVKESLNNIAISQKEAPPMFDAFSRYRAVQKSWEQLDGIISTKRYLLRKIMEEHNLSKKPILLDNQHVRQLSPEEILDYIRSVFYFTDKSFDWDSIKHMFYVNTFYEGEMVFKSGDFNDSIFVLIKGEIVLYANSPSNEDGVEITRLHKGDIIGESCISHEPFLLNGRATEFTEIIGLHSDNLQKIVDKYPVSGINLYKQILFKIVVKRREDNQRIAKMIGTPAAMGATNFGS